MSKSKGTKRSLLASLTSLLLCVAMLIGSTFAWFTDTASTAVNKIQAGTLDVALEMKDGENWVDAEGKTLEFKKATGAANGEKVLWEPGCTYELPELRIVNEGDLALKYKIIITGIKGSAKLNEAIEWTITNDADTAGTDLANTEYHLTATGTDNNFDILTIKGHMKEEAGNEYQGLSIDGISITVYATQVEGEYDSTGNQYDSGAAYNYKSATIMSETDGETITLESGSSYTVGAATVTVAENGDITYTNTGATTGQTVTITTNGGKLTVNAPKDTIHHYGESEFVDVQQTASESFHEFGKVAVLAVASGRVVIEKGNNVAVLQVKQADSSQSGEEAAAPVIAVPQNEVLETKIERADDVTEIKIVTIAKAASAEGATDAIVETATINFAASAEGGAEETTPTVTIIKGAVEDETSPGEAITTVPAELQQIFAVSDSTEDQKVVVKESTVGAAQEYPFVIGTKPYATLAEAVGAAQGGDTIKMMESAEVTGTTTFTEGAVTLDLNGNTLTVDVSQLGGVNDGFIVGSGAALTLANSVADRGTFLFRSNSASNDGIYVYNTEEGKTASLTVQNPVELEMVGEFSSAIHTYAPEGTSKLTIEDGTLIDITTTEQMMGILLDQNSEVTMNGGEFKLTGNFDQYSDNNDTVGILLWGINGSQKNINFTMNGGKLTVGGKNAFAQGIQVGNVNNCSENVTVVIQGGEICAAENEGGLSYGFTAYNGDSATFTMTGGTVSGTLQALTTDYDGDSVNLKVSGGTFSMDPTSYLADGYKATENPEGTWTVAVAESTPVDTDDETNNDQV